MRWVIWHELLHPHRVVGTWGIGYRHHMCAGAALLEGEKEEVNYHLARLTKSLRRTYALQKLHHIRRARVPIIKVPAVASESLSMSFASSRELFQGLRFMDRCPGPGLVAEAAPPQWTIYAWHACRHTGKPAHEVLLESWNVCQILGCLTHLKIPFAVNGASARFNRTPPAQADWTALYIQSHVCWSLQ